MDFSELNQRGWMIVDNIESSDDLLNLGRTIGAVTATPNGELIKMVRRESKEKAPKGSQSAKYGFGPFPLHTDTVFWDLPVKYVLLRGYGDVRRPTTVFSFEELFAKRPSKIRSQVENSIWHIRAGRTNFYSQMRIEANEAMGWRYDVDLMSPANSAAKDVNCELHTLVMTEGHPVFWTGCNALVVNNRVALHGRGNMPDDEGERVVERLYVR